LQQIGEHFILWKASLRDGGKYYCQGVRQTVVGQIKTQESLPLEINVDGGWAILQVPPRPRLVGYTLTATCRVRLEPELQEVILYKDGTEVRRQSAPNANVFHMTNLTLKDDGTYSCRASWDINRRTRSVISAGSRVQVLEVVSQPHLEIVTVAPTKKMKLICHHEYNAPDSSPQLNYYFYKNNNQLGPSTSDNHYVVTQTPGQYSCKVRVPQLNLVRWSEPKSFGQVRVGSHVMVPVNPPPRVLQPLAAPAASVDLIPPPIVKPTPSQPSPLRSTATPTEKNNLLPGTLPLIRLQSTVQLLNQSTTPEPQTVKSAVEPDDLSGGSGDMPDESNISQGSLDTVQL
ncbi:hypothetical protein L3Q82_018764, partial [Scortum barcoo]